MGVCFRDNFSVCGSRLAGFVNASKNARHVLPSQEKQATSSSLEA